MPALTASKSTLTNADTATLSTGNIGGLSFCKAFQVNYTLNSGTGAGTSQLQQSLDGVNFINVGSAYTITNTASQSNIFTVAVDNVAAYYQVLVTTTGTQSLSVAGFYEIGRKN